MSVNGGAEPVWASDGSALYYRAASGELMEVPTTLTPRFIPSRPRPLFQYAGVFRLSGTAAAYDIHPDGRRFIMVTESERPTGGRMQINMVLNWHEELKQRVPVK